MTGTDLDEVNVPSDLDGKQVNIKDLSKFSVKRVLSINYKRKTICILGTFTDRQGIAIIFLEKAPIKYESIKLLCSSGCKIEKDEISADLLQCFPESDLNKLKVTLIYPATEKHVKKYEFLPIHIIEETAELYNHTTLPCITSSSFNLQWVYNIFDHKAEQESIIYEDLDPDTGFLFLPDLKWNQNQVENLYVLAIARPRNIKSLRDLTGKHLPLLKNIRDKGKQIIKDKFGLDELQLRIYLHYQPSYYHLHVHFTNIDYQAPGINVTKSHLLDTVINNIELMSDYYQKTVLSFTVKESDNLFLCYKEKGLVKEVPPKEDIDIKDEEKKNQKDEITE